MAAKGKISQSTICITGPEPKLIEIREKTSVDFGELWIRHIEINDRQTWKDA